MPNSIKVEKAVEDAVLKVLKKAAGHSRSKEWCNFFGMGGEINRLVSKIVKMTNKEVPLSKREHKRATLAVLKGLQSTDRLRRSKSGLWIFKKEILQKPNMLKARAAKKESSSDDGRQKPYVNVNRHPIPEGAR